MKGCVNCWYGLIICSFMGGIYLESFKEETREMYSQKRAPFDSGFIMLRILLFVITMNDMVVFLSF